MLPATETWRLAVMALGVVPAGTLQVEYWLDTKLAFQDANDVRFRNLYEVEMGEFRLTGASARTLQKGTRKPVMEYLQAQSRFRIMTSEQAAEVQAQVDVKWRTYSSGGGC